MARSKYEERFCGYCNRQAKMEILGSMDGVADKVWYKCTRCRHLSLLAVDAFGILGKGIGHIDAASAAQYDPHTKYAVGDAIFHTELDDVGRVLSKVKTSNGGQAIVVAFEKLGHRTLVENLKGEVPVE